MTINNRNVARMPRGMRNPRISSLTTFSVQTAQVFMAHPLLPNETVRKLGVGGRVALQGTDSVLSPWTLDMIVFFCPLSAMDTAYEQTFFTEEPVPLHTVAANNTQTLEKVGQEAFISQALERFHERYIWDGDDFLSANNKAKFVWPYWGKNAWMQTTSVAALDAVATPEDEDTFLDDLNAEEEGYRDILAAYGQALPVERGGLEVISWNRGKLYPVLKAPDTAGGGPDRGQIVWNVGLSKQKPFRATQPGIVVGFYVVRPVVVMGNQQASIAGELFGRHDWMVPPFDAFRLYRKLDTVRLMGTPQAVQSQVVVNLAHYYLHGESLTNIPAGATLDHFNANRSGLPFFDAEQGKVMARFPFDENTGNAFLITGAKAAAHLDTYMSILSPIVER